MKLSTQRGFDFGTSISAITVPDALRTRVRTGVDFIDGAMGGQGFTPSSVTLFTGTPGAGKTTMVLTTCAAMAKQGAISVFNTGEESLFQVKMVAERLKLNDGFLVGEETSVPDLIEKCDRIREANPGKPFFLAVDSLQTLNDEKYGDNTNSRTPERALQLLTSWAKETNAIIMVIGQVGKSGQFAGRNVLKHMVDSMLELSVVEKEDNEFYGCRQLETTKNRFGSSATQYFLDFNGTKFRTVAKLGA